MLKQAYEVQPQHHNGIARCLTNRNVGDDYLGKQVLKHRLNGLA